MFHKLKTVSTPSQTSTSKTYPYMSRTVRFSVSYVGQVFSLILEFQISCTIESTISSSRITRKSTIRSVQLVSSFLLVLCLIKLPWLEGILGNFLSTSHRPLTDGVIFNVLQFITPSLNKLSLNTSNLQLCEVCYKLSAASVCSTADRLE